jgi:hypothetical protein
LITSGRPLAALLLRVRDSRVSSAHGLLRLIPWPLGPVLCAGALRRSQGRRRRMRWQTEW